MSKRDQKSSDFNRGSSTEPHRDRSYGREEYTGYYGESEGEGYGRESAYSGVFGELSGRGYEAGPPSSYRSPRAPLSEKLIGGYYLPARTQAAEWRSNQPAREWGNEYQRGREAGPFVGRGPRNYQRSDGSIAEEINERLTQHPRLDASEIEVGVKEGVVTLTGQVRMRQDKYLAEDIIEAVWGVRAVHSLIHVELPRSNWRGAALEEEWIRHNYLEEGDQTCAWDQNLQLDQFRM